MVAGTGREVEKERERGREGGIRGTDRELVVQLLKNVVHDDIIPARDDAGH